MILHFATMADSSDRATVQAQSPDTRKYFCGTDHDPAKIAAQEKEDIVVLNASAALVIGKIAKDFKEGVEIARSALKDGKAAKKLLELIEQCGDTEKLKEAERKFIDAT